MVTVFDKVYFGKQFVEMTVVKDEWTPLFNALEKKVNSAGRRLLLSQMIGGIYDITVLNFGPTGIARPSEWPSLSSNYAQENHEGDTTPTLILSGELLNSFQIEITDQMASLTNLSPYADDHQFGVPYRNLPARPYYPVTEDGYAFTDYMQVRLDAIIDQHFQI